MGILEKTYLNKHKGLLGFAYVGRGYGVEVTLLPTACWTSVWGVWGAVTGTYPVSFSSPGLRGTFIAHAITSLMLVMPHFEVPCLFLSPSSKWNAT